ncbi:MAG: RAD55 family ATPase [Candidatus Hodarchaeota archaeon]
MFNELRKSNLEKSGIVFLDNMLGGGFPPSAAIVVVGESGVGKSIMCQKFIHEGLENGEGGIYVALSESSNTVTSMMKRMGWDITNYLENEQLMFIEGSPSKSMFVEGGYFDPRNLSLLNLKIASAFSYMRKYDKVRLVIDSLSDLIEYDREGQFIMNFLDELVANIRLDNASCLCTLTPDVQPEELRRRVQSSFDGEIEFRFTEVAGNHQRQIRIRRMKNRDPNSDWISFALANNEGMVPLSIMGGGQLEIFALTPQIYDVYIIDRNGYCLFNAKSENAEYEVDVVSAFLTAVSTFAKQMLPSEGELSGIRKGNLQILCEWGQKICVTVVCTTETAEDEVRSKMRVLVDTFEVRFNHILEYWNGDLSVFRPVERLVRRYFGSHLHRIENGEIVRPQTQLYSIDDFGSKAYWEYYRDSKGFRLFVSKNKIPIREIDKLVNLISDSRLNANELEKFIEKGDIKLTRESATKALMNLQKREIIYLVS